MRKKLPTAVRFMLRHVGVGFGLATLLMAGLFWADPGGGNREPVLAPARAR